jgi:predicted DNA-binding transcriptional regulator AlpA
LISVETLAEILHKTPKAVHDLRYRKLLPPAVRVGGRIYWLAEDIEAWLQGQREVAG